MQSDGAGRRDPGDKPEQALHLTLPHSALTNPLGEHTNGMLTKRAGDAEWVGIAGMLEYKI